jgi:hypothetical protein
MLQMAVIDEERESKLSVHVSPNASKNGLVSFENGILRVKIAAPPVKGKANAELAAFLAKVLDIKKGQVAIVKGAGSRDKLVAIEGMKKEDVSARLRQLVSLNKQRAMWD